MFKSKRRLPKGLRKTSFGIPSYSRCSKNPSPTNRLLHCDTFNPKADTFIGRTKVKSRSKVTIRKWSTSFLSSKERDKASNPFFYLPIGRGKSVKYQTPTLAPSSGSSPHCRLPPHRSPVSSGCRR